MRAQNLRSGALTPCNRSRCASSQARRLKADRRKETDSLVAARYFMVAICRLSSARVSAATSASLEAIADRFPIAVPAHGRHIGGAVTYRGRVARALPGGGGNLRKIPRDAVEYRRETLRLTEL